jgi:hypothetical protein
LHQVWHDAHWRIWQVGGFHGLVDAGASVVSLTPDKVTLAVQRAGTHVVRIRDSGHWAVSGDACTRATSDGWTELVDAPQGNVVMSLALRGSRCPR